MVFWKRDTYIIGNNVVDIYNIYFFLWYYNNMHMDYCTLCWIELIRFDKKKKKIPNIPSLVEKIINLNARDRISYGMRTYNI